jgi:hypothetical protein
MGCGTAHDGSTLEKVQTSAELCWDISADACHRCFCRNRIFSPSKCVRRGTASIGIGSWCGDTNRFVIRKSSRLSPAERRVLYTGSCSTNSAVRTSPVALVRSAAALAANILPAASVPAAGALAEGTWPVASVRAAANQVETTQPNALAPCVGGQASGVAAEPHRLKGLCHQQH